MGTEVVRAGQPAPKFKVKAVGSGREISPEALAGQVAVLVFVNQDTQRDGRGIIKAIREQSPGASQVTIATAVDLSAVPIILKGMAENAPKESYQKSVARLAAGPGPAPDVLHPASWEGGAPQTSCLSAQNKHAALCLLCPTRVIRGSYAGAPGGPAAGAVAGGRGG